MIRYPFQEHNANGGNFRWSIYSLSTPPRVRAPRSPWLSTSVTVSREPRSTGAYSRPGDRGMPPSWLGKPWPTNRIFTSILSVGTERSTKLSMDWRKPKRRSAYCRAVREMTAFVHSQMCTTPCCCLKAWWTRALRRPILASSMIAGFSTSRLQASTRRWSAERITSRNCPSSQAHWPM